MKAKPEIVDAKVIFAERIKIVLESLTEEKALPDLPKVCKKFEDKKLYCEIALKKIRDLTLELVRSLRAEIAAFLKNHDSFCLLSLDCRGIQRLLYHSPSKLYDVNKVILKELGSTLTASARKVDRHLISYAQEIQSQHPELDTRFTRLGLRTFLLYTSKKCKPLPRLRLSRLARISDQIDWIPVELEPDPFLPPKRELGVNFDAYVATDEGIVTTLEYLIRRFKDTADNLKKIERIQEEVAKLAEELSVFAQYYSRFI